jgi:hypothetical protein
VREEEKGDTSRIASLRGWFSLNLLERGVKFTGKDRRSLEWSCSRYMRLANMFLPAGFGKPIFNFEMIFNSH